MLVDSLIQLAIPVAGLLKEKEANKYRDELLSIQKELHDEELKPIPDDGRISYLHIELVRITTVLRDTAFAKAP